MSILDHEILEHNDSFTPPLWTLDLHLRKDSGTLPMAMSIHSIIVLGAARAPRCRSFDMVIDCYSTANIVKCNNSNNPGRWIRHGVGVDSC